MAAKTRAAAIAVDTESVTRVVNDLVVTEPAIKQTAGAQPQEQLDEHSLPGTNQAGTGSSPSEKDDRTEG
jgi:hypothetical protein